MGAASCSSEGRGDWQFSREAASYHAGVAHHGDGNQQRGGSMGWGGPTASLTAVRLIQNGEWVECSENLPRTGAAAMVSRPAEGFDVITRLGYCWRVRAPSVCMLGKRAAPPAGMDTHAPVMMRPVTLPFPHPLAPCTPPHTWPSALPNHLPRPIRPKSRRSSSPLRCGHSSSACRQLATPHPQSQSKLPDAAAYSAAKRWLATTPREPC